MIEEDESEDEDEYDIMLDSILDECDAMPSFSKSDLDGTTEVETNH